MGLFERTDLSGEVASGISNMRPMFFLESLALGNRAAVAAVRNDHDSDPWSEVAPQPVQLVIQQLAIVEAPGLVLVVRFSHFRCLVGPVAAVPRIENEEQVVLFQFLHHPEDVSLHFETGGPPVVKFQTLDATLVQTCDELLVRIGIVNRARRTGTH